MTPYELTFVVGVVYIAALTQVLSGFGFALLSVPLMTIAVPTKEAVVISTLLGAGVSSWQAWHGRRHVVRPAARWMIVGAYMGMPIGLVVFVTVDESVLRLILGVAVLMAVVSLAMNVNLAHVGSRLDVGAGFLSGMLNTSLSTNGPPLVFALQARQLSPDAFRATINTVFSFSNVVGITLFVIAGKVTVDGVTAAAVAMPALLLGQLSGFPLRKHVSAELFRWLVLGLLVVAACSTIFSALR